MRICQSLHKIRCHGAPHLQIQLQTPKIVMQQRARFYAVCISAPNHFGLVLYDVINYNDVIFTGDS